jgi:hypothetical protein
MDPVTLIVTALVRGLVKKRINRSKGVQVGDRNVQANEF